MQASKQKKKHPNIGECIDGRCVVWDLVFNCSQDSNGVVFDYGNYNSLSAIIAASQTADMVKIGDWYNNPNKTVWSKYKTKPIIYFQNGIELSGTHNVDLGKITNVTNITEWVIKKHINYTCI